MDYHSLQKKLFDIEPTSIAEDKARLIAQANGGGASNAPIEATPKIETAQVAEGSLQMDKDYSLNDFAALAGVETTVQKVAQPVMEAGPDPIIIQDKNARIAQLEERVARLEQLLEAKNDSPKIKPRDPNAQTMQDLRKSGAMGAHKDKKKLAKQGYQKHKSKNYEGSIKEQLMAKLAEYELKK